MRPIQQKSNFFLCFLLLGTNVNKPGMGDVIFALSLLPFYLPISKNTRIKAKQLTPKNI